MTYTVVMYDYVRQQEIVVQTGLSLKVAKKCTSGLNYYATRRCEFWYRKGQS
jgi:nitrous oxide reductase